jgi:RNA polymerase-binding transcription factor DksA
MAKFLTGNGLNTELENLLINAQAQIILISPYIQLHSRYISALKTKLDNPNLAITIIFGKNVEDMSKSMKQDDFSFFKEFPNIEILYEPLLHAKYYANERSAILTSMNLYSYSQDNNIEAGVLIKSNLLGNFANKIWEHEENLDNQAWHYFEKVIDQADLLFRKVPEYENKLFGLNKKYKSSIIEVDKLSSFFENKPSYEKNKKIKDENRKIINSSKVESEKQGYCIRTGEKIPFNYLNPMTDKALSSWNKFKKDDYEEKYCHFSGEESYGETTKAKPILWKNWRKAKEEHKF